MICNFGAGRPVDVFKASDWGWNGSCKVVKVVTMIVIVPLDFKKSTISITSKNYGVHNFCRWGYRSGLLTSM